MGAWWCSCVCTGQLGTSTGGGRLAALPFFASLAPVLCTQLPKLLASKFERIGAVFSQVYCRTADSFAGALAPLLRINGELLKSFLQTVPVDRSGSVRTLLATSLRPLWRRRRRRACWRWGPWERCLLLMVGTRRKCSWGRDIRRGVDNEPQNAIAHVVSRHGQICVSGNGDQVAVFIWKGHSTDGAKSRDNVNFAPSTNFRDNRLRHVRASESFSNGCSRQQKAEHLAAHEEWRERVPEQTNNNKRNCE